MNLKGLYIHFIDFVLLEFYKKDEQYPHIPLPILSQNLREKQRLFSIRCGGGGGGGCGSLTSDINRP